MDLEGRDAFDLLDELEQKLSIKVRPLSWPISQGHTFQGVYNLFDGTLRLFQSDKQRVTEDLLRIEGLSDPALDEMVGDEHAAQLREDCRDGRGRWYDPLDMEAYARGEVAPVFFGSAVNNFGVQEMLDSFIRIAPTPRPRSTTQREVDPTEEKFSGFIFKIHANIRPAS